PAHGRLFPRARPLRRPDQPAERGVQAAANGDGRGDSRTWAGGRGAGRFRRVEFLDAGRGRRYRRAGAEPARGGCAHRAGPALLRAGTAPGDTYRLAYSSIGQNRIAEGVALIAAAIRETGSKRP